MSSPDALSSSSPESSRWVALTRAWYAFPLGLFFATRLGYASLSWLGAKWVPETYAKVKGANLEVLRDMPWLEGLCRWDCGWFQEIAANGYTEIQATNFWPLYPLLTAALSKATGIHLNLWLVIVPSLASLLAYLCIYRLFEHLDGPDAARWGLATFVVFPFAFFQSAGYPESLLVAFTSLAVLYAVKDRHFSAGAAMALGILSRHLAVFAWPSLALIQLRQRGFRKLLDWRLLGLLIPALGIGAWMLFLDRTFGDPIAFINARDKWGTLAYRSVFEPFTREKWEWVDAYIFFALVPFAGSVALLFRKRWWDLALFALPFMIFIMAVGLTSLGRYCAVAWPAFLPIGVLLARRTWLQIPTLMTAGMFHGLFFFLYTRQWWVF